MRAAREFAIGALARREHSRQELERKLAARGLASAPASAALDGLAEEGLQDDGRFAESYMRQRAERGYGPRRIVSELRQRGVQAPLIASVLAAAEHDWDALAAGVRQRKFGAPPRSAPERARQTRFLEYRGFEAAQIRHALTQTADDEDF